MAYHIYTTEGLVLSCAPTREADRVYNILTRDLGLVRATALGVRHEKSKLRGHMEPLSLSSVSLVKGKEYWRVTSAVSIQSLPRTNILAKPLSLVEKFVQGESHHPELFDVVKEAVLSDSTLDEMFEIRFVSQILYHLGYLKESDLSLDKKNLILAINQGIEASQMI